MLLTLSFFILQMQNGSRDVSGHVKPEHLAKGMSPIRNWCLCFSSYDPEEDAEVDAEEDAEDGAEEDAEGDPEEDAEEDRRGRRRGRRSGR